jgi:hypothetical protein
MPLSRLAALTPHRSPVQPVGYRQGTLTRRSCAIAGSRGGIQIVRRAGRRDRPVDPERGSGARLAGTRSVGDDGDGTAEPQAGLTPLSQQRTACSSQTAPAKPYCMPSGVAPPACWAIVQQLPGRSASSPSTNALASAVAHPPNRPTTQPSSSSSPPASGGINSYAVASGHRLIVGCSHNTVIDGGALVRPPALPP